MKERKKEKIILTGIIIAIVAGFIVGGLFPGFSLHVEIAGKMFLNLLMMIVVPLVIFSMITGITNLGDIRKVGKIGGRTVLYYFATTALSVTVGILLVNIIQPGKGVVSGEKNTAAYYRLSGDSLRTVNLAEGEFDRKYRKGYILSLHDQKIEGEIKSSSPDTITVREWKCDGEEKEGGVPCKVEKGKICRGNTELALSASGKGYRVYMPLSGNIRKKKDVSVSGTLGEVIVGNENEGREGLIPRNIVNAMVRMEILPLIFFSLLFGAALSTLKKGREEAVAFISTCNDAILKIVDWIMVLAPAGIFAIVAARIGKAGGFEGFMPELKAVGLYSATVCSGLAVHGIIVLPLLLRFLGKRGPYRYFSGVLPALLNAFSTASSSATLPLTMENVEKKNGVSERTAGFVLPIGATINMDGTALYEAVAALFIAQSYGIDLNGAQQLVIFLTSTLAAIGAAGIPEAGLVTMVIVLRAVGLPLEGIGMILTVDGLLDRFRTTVNVWGDAVGAGIIERLENETVT